MNRGIAFFSDIEDGYSDLGAKVVPNSERVFTPFSFHKLSESIFDQRTPWLDVPRTTKKLTMDGIQN